MRLLYYINVERLDDGEWLKCECPPRFHVHYHRAKPDEIKAYVNEVDFHPDPETVNQYMHDSLKQAGVEFIEITNVHRQNSDRTSN